MCKEAEKVEIDRPLHAVSGGTGGFFVQIAANAQDV